MPDRVFEPRNCVVPDFNLILREFFLQPRKGGKNIGALFRHEASFHVTDADDPPAVSRDRGGFCGKAGYGSRGFRVGGSCGRERLPEKRGGEKPEEGCEQNAARKTGKSAAPKP